jgi:hypothetical protein
LINFIGVLLEIRASSYEIETATKTCVKIRTDSLHGEVAIVTETDDASVTSLPADRCLYKQAEVSQPRDKKKCRQAAA